MTRSEGAVPIRMPHHYPAVKNLATILTVEMYGQFYLEYFDIQLMKLSSYTERSRARRFLNEVTKVQRSV